MIEKVVLSIHGFIWGFILVAVIYFGYKAYKKHGKEGFEERDN